LDAFPCATEAEGPDLAVELVPASAVAGLAPGPAGFLSVAVSVFEAGFAGLAAETLGVLAEDLVGYCLGGLSRWLSACPVAGDLASAPDALLRRHISGIKIDGERLGRFGMSRGGALAHGVS
jgi:hypothetical protein